MSDQGEGAIKNLGMFSALQAATDIKVFLLSAAFTFLVDNILVSLNQPGLVDLAKNKQHLADSNIAFQVILIFIGFSFLTSIILPVAAAICDQVYILTADKLITKIGIAIDRIFKIESRPFRREHNKVTLLELMNEAHETKEKYYLDLYKEAKEDWGKWQENVFRFALYSFSCLSMLTINLYLSHIGKNTISKYVEEFFESAAPIWIFITGLIIMFVWRFYDQSEPTWIHCPSLYEKIEAERIRRIERLT
jgi:hypothetical protein